MAVYIKLFIEMRYMYLGGGREGLLGNHIDLIMAGKLILLSVIICMILILLSKFNKIFLYIDKYRYIIAIALIVICTAANLNGSSIGMYHLFLGYHYNNTEELLSEGTLIGVPRWSRTDDYATFIPMNFSQYYNNFMPVSEILRATPTDVTTMYGAPALSLATLFRPFLWGYILLGNSYGLAFYWSSRLFVLLLVSYEAGKLLSRGNKLIGITYAVMVTFSQTIQWWYSTNGLVEMFIYAQLAVILMYNLPRVRKIWQIICIALGISYCALGYILAYYPAWQVPLFYILLIVIIYVIINSRRLYLKEHIYALIGSFLILIIAGSVILYNSYDTIITTMNTDYPGNRVNTGGSIPLAQLFYYAIGIFTPIDEYRLLYGKTFLQNVNEVSTFYSIFPLGIILSIYSMIKRRKVDVLALPLIILEIIYVIYCVWGLPDIIVKITMLRYTISPRVMEIIGYIDILLLIRILSTKRSEPAYNTRLLTSRTLMICGSIIMTSVIVISLIITGYNPVVSIWVLAAVLAAWIIYSILLRSREHLKTLCIVIIYTIGLSGILVNPLQQGADVILKDSLTNAITDIRKAEPDATWIVIGDKTQLNNIPIMAGARTINSTNTYPALDTWARIDPFGYNKSAYNRYAHILMDVTDGDNTFTIKQPDLINIEVNLEGLNNLGVDYILSEKSLNEYDMRCLYNMNGFYIYSLED